MKKKKTPNQSRPGKPGKPAAASGGRSKSPRSSASGDRAGQSTAPSADRSARQWRKLDPAAASEAERYEDPIPSRELMLTVLRDAAGPLTIDELIGHFGLKKLNQQTAIERRLLAMLRDGQLVQNRKGAFGPATQMNVLAGHVQAHRDGFGFLIRDDGGPDVFLPPRHMRELMNGDRIQARITGTDFKGRPEGALVEVLERASREIVGRMHVEQGVSYVIPDNPRVHQDVLIPPEQRNEAKHGQMVVAEITAPPGQRTLAVGRVIEILGEHLAPGMEIEAAIRAHGLPMRWPSEIDQQVRKLPEEVTEKQKEGRVDLRDLPLVTIDGIDARDFDDAVLAKKMASGGWTLWVAIADVSAYVTQGSALDREAANRGNSVYFPQRVLPMLPEELSNGLCSLNPDVDRLAFVCEMRVDAEGQVKKSRFYEAVIRSHARLIYEDVAEMIADPKGEKATKRKAIMPQLIQLHALFEALYVAREQRGAIDFDTSDTRIVFGPDRKIEEIVPITRNVAHRMIEECMIAANVQAAMRVDRFKLPAPYRIHDVPDAMKVQTLREFLAERGLRLSGGARPEPLDYASLSARAAERPDRQLIQTVILRSLMQARYAVDNVGHFGLALEYYGHFTSPIRRYPDLLLHRALKYSLTRKAIKGFSYSADDMDRHCAHCSMTERRADEATRDVVTWLKCEYMSERVGEVHEGTVTGVASFGLFVELDGLYVDGMIHVSQLRNDYYRYEPRHHELIGERNGQRYALGQRLKVRVTRVNLDERKIDLEPFGHDPRPGKPSKSESSGAKNGPKTHKARQGSAKKGKRK